MIKSGHKTGGGISSIRIKHNLYDIFRCVLKNQRFIEPKDRLM